MAGFFEFAEDGRRFLLLVSVAMARLTPVFQITPFLGGRHLGTVARGTLAFSLALFLSSWLAAHAPAEAMGIGQLLPILIKEALLGTLFGFLSSLAFSAASGVGFLVDNQRGLSMSQTSDPLTGEETSLLGGLAMQTLVMVFIAGGGLALFIQGVLTTYAFWPPFSFWPDWSAAAVRELVLGQFAWYLATLTALAAPMLLVCFLVDFGMGLMNRFAPQLNVFFLAMPVKSGLVLALLVVFWGTMIAALRGDLMRLPLLWEALRGALGLPAGGGG
ncbi:MAG: type III secretion system export apparatus subunit SctT [Planctomycetes bacterium]|nr:type III secretion system export apparatus subunit SctT [Planctomycetota bacterium]